MSDTKLIIGIAAAISVEITGDSTPELIREAAFWNELPPVCPKCGAGVVFTYRNPQTFHYYGMRCLGSPAHETTFGQYREGTKGLYYKHADSWGDAHARSDEEQPNGNRESRAEHDRLDSEIRKAWNAVRPNMDFANSVKTKYDKTPEQLSIEEKRHILTALTAI